jgi:hypothetical protein
MGLKDYYTWCLNEGYLIYVCIRIVAVSPAQSKATKHNITICIPWTKALHAGWGMCASILLCLVAAQSRATNDANYVHKHQRIEIQEKKTETGRAQICVSDSVASGCSTVESHFTKFYTLWILKWTFICKAGRVRICTIWNRSYVQLLYSIISCPTTASENLTIRGKISRCHIPVSVPCKWQY